MRFLVNALFGTSNSKTNELDVFMRRLDRIAQDRAAPFRAALPPDGPGGARFRRSGSASTA
jgi:hypothetical protein